MRPVKICKTCGKDRKYLEAHQKYTCYPCNAEYVKKWRLQFPEKVEESNRKQKEKREKLKINKVVEKKYCDKHQQPFELAIKKQWFCRECRRLYGISYRAIQEQKVDKKQL